MRDKSHAFQASPASGISSIRLADSWPGQHDPATRQMAVLEVTDFGYYKGANWNVAILDVINTDRMWPSIRRMSAAAPSHRATKKPDTIMKKRFIALRGSVGARIFLSADSDRNR